MQGRRGSAGISWSHSSWKISLRSSSPTINSALPGPALSHGPEHSLFEHFQGQWLQHFPGFPTSHQRPCDSVSSAADSAPRGSHLQGWGVWGAVSLHRRSPGWLDLKLLPPCSGPGGHHSCCSRSVVLYQIIFPLHSSAAFFAALSICSSPHNLAHSPWGVFTLHHPFH